MGHFFETYMVSRQQPPSIIDLKLVLYDPLLNQVCVYIYIYISEKGLEHHTWKNNTFNGLKYWEEDQRLENCSVGGALLNTCREPMYRNPMSTLAEHTNL